MQKFDKILVKSKGKGLLVFAITIFAFTLQIVSAENYQFNDYIKYSKQWLVISNTARTKTPCKESPSLNTSFFNNLASGLFICVEKYFDNEMDAKAATKLPQYKSYYIKNAGFYYEQNKNLKAPHHKNTLFSIPISDSVGILCSIDTLPADEVYIEQGYSYTFKTTFRTFGSLYIDKNNKNFNLPSFPNIKQYRIAPKHTLFLIESTSPGSSKLDVLIFDASGRIEYERDFFSEGDENSYEITNFTFEKDRPTLITKRKLNGKESKSALTWNGNTFK